MYISLGNQRAGLEEAVGERGCPDKNPLKGNPSLVLISVIC